MESEWEAEQIAGEGDTRITRHALRIHLIPALGPYAMLSLRRTHIQALFKKLSEQLGPDGVRNVYEFPVRVTAAAEDKVTAASLCKRITLPPVTGEKIAPPSDAQVAAMYHAKPPYLRAAMVVLAGQFRNGAIRVDRRRCNPV